MYLADKGPALLLYREVLKIIKMNASRMKVNEGHVHGVLRRHKWLVNIYKGNQLQKTGQHLPLADISQAFTNVHALRPCNFCEVDKCPKIQIQEYSSNHFS